MQLRVARLCLDCENLHVEDRCPVCGSETFAFLSTWLPSEERRRWRRAPTTAGAATTKEPAPHRLLRRVARWMGFDLQAVRRNGPPLTRASDRVPDLNFEGRRATDGPRPQPAEQPLTQSHD
jgi:hypothetical protein